VKFITIIFKTQRDMYKRAKEEMLSEPDGGLLDFAV